MLDAASRDPVVLVVDDEPANQRALRRALIEECGVRTAGSGAEALEVLERHPIALAVVDQRMPGMTGIDLLREIVARHPRVIRVVLTGYIDVETLTDAINQGHVYHFLTKPWEVAQLRQVVRRGLERHAADAERARLLAELERACERVRREAEQKSRLLALTTHELGTPVHLLLNSLELIEDSAVAESSRVWMDTARRASHWLARSVVQIDDATRFRERPLRLRVEQVEVAPLLADLIVRLRERMAGRRLSVEARCGADCGTVAADARWVRQAVWNLLTNAVRFTPDGGAVCLESLPAAGEIVVAVADTGVGIAPTEIEEIFEPFSAATGDPLLHGSGLLAFGARGLGLGLALVRRVAHAHGGSVEVSSAVGSGSRFALRLPRRGPAAEILSAG